MLPAPLGVPVDRLVGIGLVGPRTERPVSGVWASSRSMPVPPGRRVVRALVRLEDFVVERAGELFFFPRGGLALAVFRPVLRRAVDARRAAAPLRAAARDPAAADLFDTVRFRPVFDRLADEPAFRPDVFFAMCLTLGR